MLWLFNLGFPCGERSDPLLLHLISRIPGAGIEHHFAMLFEGLTLEDLGKEVGSVLIGRDVLYLHDAGAPHLTQLEQLAIDMAGVLCRRVFVAQLPCAGLPTLARLLLALTNYGH